ncbi:SGNH/GDSL hydrolase family protein [Cytophagaceae bacterium ABcell3]|nr:SGNH/GDSL hydrolase family protein [Cytophagaceae bacterium ABcell3]
MKKEIIHSILALGDSYTIGEGVGPQERFPNQFAERLEDNSGQKLKVDIVAKTGWTTGELIEGVSQAYLQPPYDLVFLLIGVNNQYRRLPLSDYRHEFKELLITARDFCSHEKGVWVLSVPDWGETPFGKESGRADIAEKIDSFNAVNKEEATKQGYCYVDITSITRNISGKPDLLAEDKLHYSGRMYELWAEELVKLVE